MLPKLDPEMDTFFDRFFIVFLSENGPKMGGQGCQKGPIKVQ